MNTSGSDHEEIKMLIEAMRSEEMKSALETYRMQASVEELQFGLTRAKLVAIEHELNDNCLCEECMDTRVAIARIKDMHR